MKRGTKVTYRLWHTPAGHVEAVVRRLHRDGSATVEARFFVDPDGRRSGCYLGYRYRVDTGLLAASTDGRAA
jgi:hypothetical protein